MVALVIMRYQRDGVGRHPTTAWGKASVEESGLGLYGCVMNVVMKYSPC